MAYSPTLMRWMQQDPRGYVDGLNRYQPLKENPIRLLDPEGTEIFVYPSEQVDDAGAVVAAAFQKVLGKAADIYSEKVGHWTRASVWNHPTPPFDNDWHWENKWVTDYWVIKYKNPKKCGGQSAAAFGRFKEAVDSGRTLKVFLGDKGPSGGSLESNGYGVTDPNGIFGSFGIVYTKWANSYVDYRYLTTHNVTVQGETERQVADPFEIVLWHEVVGHGGNYIAGRPDEHGQTTPKYPGYDIIIGVENLGRDAWNEANPTEKPLGEAMHMYTP